MKSTNHSQSSVFPTVSSQVSEVQSVGSQPSKAQSEIPTLLSSESLTQNTFVVSPQTHPATEFLHPNRTSKAVVLVVASVMGMTVFSGVAYIMLIKLNVLQRSQPSRIESTQPQWNQGEQSMPSAESPIQVQKSNELQATMLLDRARRLAIAHRFEDAIAEANKVPFDSLLYQQTQLEITRWVEQAQQKEAEQRAIQQSNYQHLQAAQQALDQEDWRTALQAVNQINVNVANQDLFWQQQKDSVVQKIEPYQHEQKAQELLDQGELRNAYDEVSQLPPVAPWREKQAIILEAISQRLADKKVAETWNKRCRSLSQGNISRCPSLDDVKEIVDLLPSTRWLPGLTSSGRKSKH